jgi:hypothetical protein
VFRLIVAFPSPVCEVAAASPEAASLSASWLVLLAAMVMRMLLRCATKDEVLYLPLRIEIDLRRLWIVALGQV